ncbi:hypothetical protein A4H97_23705 [Niastella yeongjuensis]|uniref:Uncharacterized protein n=1 Tax=Niastella yeongjuensis TaxID=354355 RepID=A0A1V9F500_9BACT|nr:hypothetical protein [Niastella yeongjuensis]OQP53453.1 hypothetical protein A4H97_23705 [Niastella yeongjuensis]SEP11847.1 hypothetical protein SAMN05660816_04459 [Niastella yeongjuensis]
MKRFFIMACGAALGVALTLFFSYLTSQPTIINKPAPITPCECCYESFFGLTMQEFMDGVGRYGKTRPQLLGPDNKDARACWYSIDTLKKYICQIEKYSHKLHIDTQKLGIRFFYAVYPENIPNVRYRNHHTLFMVPTQFVNGANVDFDPRYTLKAGIKPQSAVLRQVPLTEKPLILGSLSADDSFSNPEIDMGKNQGQLCPPICSEEAAGLLDYIDKQYGSTSSSNQ